MSPKAHPNPETAALNRSGIRRRVLKSLKKGGIDIPSGKLTDALVDLVMSERIDVRETIANRVITPVIGRYESVDDEKLEMLAVVAEYYRVDELGVVHCDLLKDGAE